VNVQAYDADLGDLADGKLTSSKIDTGSLPSDVIASSVAVNAIGVNHVDWSDLTDDTTMGLVSALDFDAEHTLYVNASTNRVGIGTDSPDGQFQVGGGTFTVRGGKVGIGTNDPDKKFVITGSTAFKVDPQTGYVSIFADDVEVVRIKP